MSEGYWEKNIYCQPDQVSRNNVCDCGKTLPNHLVSINICQEVFDAQCGYREARIWETNDHGYAELWIAGSPPAGDPEGIKQDREKDNCRYLKNLVILIKYVPNYTKYDH